MNSLVGFFMSAGKESPFRFCDLAITRTHGGPADADRKREDAIFECGIFWLSLGTQVRMGGDKHSVCAMDVAEEAMNLLLLFLLLLVLLLARLAS